MRPGGVPRRDTPAPRQTWDDATEAEGWASDADIDSFFEILPNTEATEQPYTAYNQGYGAYMTLGVASLGRCPYPPGREQVWWEMGQEDAREQESYDDAD